MYPNRPYIKSLIALKVKQVNSFMEFMKDKTTDSLVPLIAIFPNEMNFMGIII